MNSYALGEGGITGLMVVLFKQLQNILDQTSPLANAKRVTDPDLSHLPFGSCKLSSTFTRRRIRCLMQLTNSRHGVHGKKRHSPHNTPVSPSPVSVRLRTIRVPASLVVLWGAERSQNGDRPVGYALHREMRLAFKRASRSCAPHVFPAAAAR